MQEKAWSTGGLKKFINKIIDKNVYGQYKKSTILVIENQPTHYGIIFDGTTEDILTNEYFVVNNTKQLVMHCYYSVDNGYYKFSTIDYPTFKEYKMIQSIINLDEAENIYGYEINANGSNNNISIKKSALPYDVGDDIEVIYKTDKYGYYVVL